MTAPTEAWLSGPVPEIAPPLWPVAHSLLQARLDAASIASDLTVDELWSRPGGAASAGFHLRHVAGVLDRLFTWARGEALTDAQRAQARAEGEPGTPPSPAAELLARFDREVTRALAQLKTTDPSHLLDAREVGSRKLPSTVQGLLFHAAEHSTRHVGQLSTTIKVVRGKK
ncbi:MAG: DinB family protein [Gemmatimonadales bacterium]